MMNSHQLQAKSALAGAPQAEPVHNQRVDKRSNEIVNQGISVQSHFNTVCAVEYLKSHNVDPDVIERVLLYPEQRRQISA
jgi:hypothetical protein